MDRAEMLRARGGLLLDYGAADASHHGVEYVRGQTAQEVI